ncbi:MAG: TrkH family potassium uptake protein [Anaerorhabdus sp.]
MFKKMSLRQKIFKDFGAMPLLALSFLLVILTGTILLSLPFTNNINPKSLLDNLFVATSATCVTGLVPFVIVEQYNIFGQIVLLIMMQIGGLGLMTLLATVLSLMKYKLFYAEKKMIQDSLSKGDLQDIPKFIKSILKYTLFFEGIGFVLICIRFIPEFGIADGLFKSLFLSVSAFCNAGIDNLGSISLGKYISDPLINFTVMALIITGGLGFIVWFELRKSIPLLLKKGSVLKKVFKSLTVHTRFVLLVTSILILSGTLLFFVLEFTNPQTIGLLSLPDKIMTSLFQSTTYRTAGFSTINFSHLNPSTKFISLLYMIIGGSPGGTAGGIKTTTFAMLFIFAFSVLKENDKINIFKREIPRITFMKAYAVFLTMLSAVFLAVFILTITENIGFIDIVFEVVSAIATVGLSTGVTSLLSSVGKSVIIVLMFIGRVGAITILLSVFSSKRKQKTSEVSYPHGELLIG